MNIELWDETTSSDRRLIFWHCCQVRPMIRAARRTKCVKWLGSVYNNNLLWRSSGIWSMRKVSKQMSLGYSLEEKGSNVRGIQYWSFLSSYRICWFHRTGCTWIQGHSIPWGCRGSFRNLFGRDQSQHWSQILRISFVDCLHCKLIQQCPRCAIP